MTHKLVINDQQKYVLICSALLLIPVNLICGILFVSLAKGLGKLEFAGNESQNNLTWKARV
jgi:hypothetical protein